MKVLGLDAECVQAQLDRLRKPLEALQAYMASAGSTDEEPGDVTVGDVCAIPSSEAVPELIPEAVGLLEDDEGPPEGNPLYMVSRTKKRGVLTVHLMTGGCYRRPGRELSSGSYLHELEDEDLNLKCKDCFRSSRLPRAVQALRTFDEDEVESSDESSSTDPEMS
jgi:hypothetical protein